MRKSTSVLLAILLLITYVFTANTVVYAAKKAENSRAIAIVFDNSGSMYLEGNMAWCRATYAMEVFAAMLNKGDTLQIYPMHPITVGGKEYTMENPFMINDASQSALIREIYSPKAEGTPVESIDAAVEGIKKITADEKYVIVLTDGTTFYKNEVELTDAESIPELDNRFGTYANKDLKMMYLGIGKKVVMPTTQESEFFTKRQVQESEDTLSTLTDMCNLVFGRDTLPKSFMTKKELKLDISISKLIVFVQGENVSGLKVTGANGPVGKMESEIITKYSTAGTGRCESIPDTSLQGMIVTYTDCAAGNYTIEYSGKGNNVEVYYEPDADLDFVFTDAEGNLVEPNSLYEGDYKVSFGMKDAKTGQLISSELLGKPIYKGSYYLNGKEYQFNHDGSSGEVPVALKMNDEFDANLTVTYLSGYVIRKTSSDFGWPEGGIKVAARPAGNLKLKIIGGDEVYPLQQLEKGNAFSVEVYYQGTKLTDKELEKVQLKWNPDTSYATIKPELAGDHYNLKLYYKDPKAPASTTCGKCKVDIEANYAAQGSDAANAKATLNYRIEDDFAPIEVELTAAQDYIVIAELEKSRELVANLTMNGKPITAEEFKSVTLQVDGGGINYKVTPNESNCTFAIKLTQTDGISEGEYSVKAVAKYKDSIGRETEAEDTVIITLSNTALWIKWVVGLSILLLLLLLIWKILHIRVLSKNVKHKAGECSMSLVGKDVTEGTVFNAKLTKKQLAIRTQYNGENAGIVISGLKPGKESFLYKPQHKRNMIVSPENVRMLGEITYADINGTGFIYDKKEGKLIPEDPEQKPFMISNNANISFDGNVDEGQRTKKFHAEIPLTFKKR